MKRIFAVLLILALTLSLCACAKTPEQLLAAAGEAIAEEKYTEAVDYLNELLVQEPENIEALSTLAETYTAMGDNASAEATLSTLTALQPDNADFVARLADMYLANGKNNEALAQYDKLVELEGTPSDELYELWLSTPLFDIQDEAVFNQKVDQMYNEVKDVVNDKTNALFTREEIEEVMLLFNISNLSQEQYDRIITINFSRVFNNYDSVKTDKIFNKKQSHFADFCSDPKFAIVFSRMDKLINEYNATNCISEENLKEMDTAIAEFKSAKNDKSELLYPMQMYSYAIVQICFLYEKATGIHHEQRGIAFDLIMADIDSYKTIYQPKEATSAD